jgi:hypothetical protein
MKSRRVEWGKAVTNGILATIVMELFYRVTSLIVHHGIDVPYANGSIFHISSLPLLYVVGYVIDLFGGVCFALLYSWFVRPKTYWSGILYAVFFVWLIADGLVFEPMGPAGILMLGAGGKAVAVNLLAHVVYGATLGTLFARAGGWRAVNKIVAENGRSR